MPENNLLNVREDKVRTRSTKEVTIFSYTDQEIK
jgi:hypothetical protein